MFGGRSSLEIHKLLLFTYWNRKKECRFMKKKWSLFLCFLFLTSCSSVNKENLENSLLQELQNKEKETQRILTNQSLSLEEAIHIAKERNLELKMKQFEKEIAKIDKNIAFGSFLPRISAFYTRKIGRAHV